MGVEFELFSADDNLTTTPSEQKLRSGPTIVGELERESRGDIDSMLGREVRLEVIGSRALTGDPVKDVMDASSEVSDGILMGIPDAVVIVDVAGDLDGVEVGVSGF